MEYDTYIAHFNYVLDITYEYTSENKEINKHRGERYIEVITDDYIYTFEIVEPKKFTIKIWESGGDPENYKYIVSTIDFQVARKEWIALI